MMRTLVASLILMSFSSQSLMAAEVPETFKPVMIAQAFQQAQPMPTPDTSLAPKSVQSKPIQQKKIELTPAGVHALANQKKDFELCKADLSSTKQAFTDCNAKAVPPLQFWQHPAFAIGAPVATIILTFIACSLAHCGGG
jgi:hypothetical protein